MKIRSSHVTNSSSSSYVCNFPDCYHQKSGWDLSLEETNMISCESDRHIFCKEHIDTKKIERREEPDVYSEEYLPSEFCPLCNFDKMSDQDLIVYLLLSSGKTREEVTAQAKTIYGTVDKLYEVWNVKQKEKKE